MGVPLKTARYKFKAREATEILMPGTTADYLTFKNTFNEVGEYDAESFELPTEPAGGTTLGSSGGAYSDEVSLNLAINIFTTAASIAAAAALRGKIVDILVEDKKGEMDHVLPAIPFVYGTGNKVGEYRTINVQLSKQNDPSEIEKTVQ